LSVRSVFDVSAHVRFPLAAIPRFLLAAIDAILLFADPPLDAHLGDDVAGPGRDQQGGVWADAIRALITSHGDGHPVDPVSGPPGR
jgi:hypothetical protein